MSIAHRHGYPAVIYYFIFTDRALDSVPHQDHHLRFAAMTPYLQDQRCSGIMGFEAKLDLTCHTACTGPVCDIEKASLHTTGPLGLRLSYPWAENSASCRIIVMTSVKHMLWALSFNFKLTSLLPAVECCGQNPLQTHVLVSLRPRHQFYGCRMSHVFSPCFWTIHICVLIWTLVLMLHGAHSILAHCLKRFHSLWFFPFPILSLSIY